MVATIGELLGWAIPRLTAAGIDTPRVDAELLLAQVCGKARGWLWAHPEQVVAPDADARFRALLAQREEREPLPYLLGEWEFYGRAFFVSPATLIPRPETELLVEAVLGWARAHGATRVADIGTGSGAIAVTLAAEAPSLSIAATDLSSAALEIARRNAARHAMAARIRFYAGDLLEPLRAAGEAPFDIMVANLPYVAASDYAGLQPEVRREPAMALHGGADGLDLIRRLIAESPSLLVPSGLLALEIGLGQAAAATALLADAHWRRMRMIDDYAGIPRHILAECPVV